MNLRYTQYAILALFLCSAHMVSAYPDSGNTKQAHQIRFGYWNDNLLWDGWGGSNSLQGNDDYITASFWFQYAISKRKTRWLFDSYYSILTNKAQRIRTDLLTIRLNMERELSFGVIQAGIGGIANGDFGGSGIQNGYHRLMGHKRVSLPYDTDTRISPLVYLRYTYQFYEFKALRLSVYTLNAQRFQVGPSAFRAGNECSLTFANKRDAPIFHLQVHTGYSKYHDSLNHYSSLFDRGFYWCVLGSIGNSHGHHIACWVTQNQYGKHQPHYGISYVFSKTTRNIINTADILYP